MVNGKTKGIESVQKYCCERGVQLRLYHSAQEKHMRGVSLWKLPLDDDDSFVQSEQCEPVKFVDLSEEDEELPDTGVMELPPLDFAPDE